MSALSLLPPELAQHSISSEEIVLPLAEALLAINILESQQLLILGWEGWVKNLQEQVGHEKALQDSTSLEHLSVAKAAAFCRTTILQSAALWADENPGKEDQLYFCLTV